MSTANPALTLWNAAIGDVNPSQKNDAKSDCVAPRKRLKSKAVTIDDETLAALRAGRQDAWARLHREEFPRIWNSVNRVLRNPSHSDDVVQEAFLKAYNEIHRFKGDSQIGTWLYRIAVNKALDFLRKQKRRERWVSFFAPVSDQEEEVSTVPDLPVEPESSKGMENADTRQQIEQAMEELSEDHRAVVQLRLIDELSLADTARVLKIKEGTVNSRLHYACEHLRRKLSLRMEDV